MTARYKPHPSKFTDVRSVNVERASRSFKQAGRMLYFLCPEIMELLQEVHS